MAAASAFIAFTTRKPLAAADKCHRENIIALEHLCFESSIVSLVPGKVWSCETGSSEARRGDAVNINKVPLPQLSWRQ